MVVMFSSFPTFIILYLILGYIIFKTNLLIHVSTTNVY